MKKPVVLAVGAVVAAVAVLKRRQAIAREVTRGKAVPGLYPPNDDTRAAYARWVDAGEPRD